MNINNKTKAIKKHNLFIKKKQNSSKTKKM